MKTLKIDPELQTLLPPLSQVELNGLEASLLAEGCRDPILTTLNHVIVDGHNRYQLCLANDMPFKVEARDFGDRQAIIEWILRNQLHRRNLTDMQRAEAALKLKPAIEVQAKENQTLSEGRGVKGRQNSAHLIKTREKVANLAGVSHDTLKKVEVIQEKADPEIAEMARAGKVSISAAAAVAKLPAKEQRDIASAGPKAVVASAKKITSSPPASRFADEVPLHVRDIFTDAAIFDAALNHLTQFSKTLGEMVGTGADATPRKCALSLHERRQEVFGLGKQLRHLIRMAKPHQLCPYCMGRKCKTCHQRGWVDEGMWGGSAIEKAMKPKVEGMIKQ